MKLTFKPDLKPQRILLHLPGEAAQDLAFFQRYLSEELSLDKQQEEILVTIIQRFFEAGDQQFLAWKRAQKNGVNEQGKRKKPGVEEGNASSTLITSKPEHA